ncbi:MAG: PD-(D/E)XK nuclease family protein, partial [Verrucomicrobiota bacterium]
SGDRESEAVSGDFDPFKRVSGAYLHVNKRLRVLAGEPRAAALFRTIDVPLTLADPHAAAAAAGAGAGGTSAAEALARWSPPADVAALGGSPHAPSAAMEKLRLYRRGFAITSYSRLKEAHGGYHPPGADAFDLTDGEAPPRLAPLEMLDVEALGEPARGHSGAKAAAANAATANADTLPGGVATGLFLHAILEKVALAPLAPLAPLATWQRQPEVRRLVEGELRRWDRDPAHFAAAARLVHAALTVPILLPEGTVLPGIARADRVRREVDFLFPLPHSLHFPPAFSPLPATSPEDALVHERGFVRGFLDVVFEHAGRVYFADWKSDALPRFDATSMRAHIDKNYDWQVRLYTLAVVRMLGIADEATYQRRFGGLVYLFLRGVTPQNTRDETSDQTSDPTSDGVHVDRPSYADVQAWSADLATLRLTAGDSGGGTP